MKRKKNYSNYHRDMELKDDKSAIYFHLTIRRQNSKGVGIMNDF